MSADFRKYLKQFNRKERFYVVRQATKGGFDLNDDFKKLLENKLEITIPGQGVFMAMDYHFDWIYASLFLSGQTAHHSDLPYKLDKKLITATQEDVDLLIAAPDPSNPMLTNLIMIEAKGATSWTNKQAKSKAERLNKIFVEGTYEHLINPHYLIWSPNASEKLDFASFPSWAKRNKAVRHIPLDMGGVEEELMKITRCGKNDSKPVTYESWKVENIGKKAKLE
jgi:hypothetical protein